MPPSLRERAARDYPEFTIVNAEGSTVTGASEHGLTEQDVIFTLRHKQYDFYMTQQYDQVFRENTQPPGWTKTTEWQTSKVEPTFEGQLDSKSRSFIRYFATEYPDGEMVYQGGFPTEGALADNEFTAWIYPRAPKEQSSVQPFTPLLVSCSFSHGREQMFMYDAAANEWLSK